MPQLGEIRKGQELGYKRNAPHIWVACAICGKQRWVRYGVREARPIHSLCPSCAQKKSGLLRRREASSLWKGGRRKTPGGYIRVSLKPDDFFYPMADKKGYVSEHRLIMAKHLGRCLQRWEIVHHKNHKRDDNRWENLVLATDIGHNQLTRLESILKRQQLEIEALRKEIRLLHWQVKELTEQLQGRFLPHG